MRFHRRGISHILKTDRVVFALIIINRAGGLIYQRDFYEGLNKLTVNDYLVLAGTFHGYNTSATHVPTISKS